jgi:GH18 family chitinase
VVFCYYGSWATYREGIAEFNVENINASLCTHIIYCFLGLKDGVIASLDEYNDFEENWGKGECIYSSGKSMAQQVARKVMSEFKRVLMNLS